MIMKKEIKIICVIYYLFIRYWFGLFFGSLGLLILNPSAKTFVSTEPESDTKSAVRKFNNIFKFIQG